MVNNYEMFHCTKTRKRQSFNRPHQKQFLITRRLLYNELERSGKTEAYEVGGH